MGAHPNRVFCGQGGLARTSIIQQKSERAPWRAHAPAGANGRHPRRSQREPEAPWTGSSVGLWFTLTHSWVSTPGGNKLEYATPKGARRPPAPCRLLNWG